MDNLIARQPIFDKHMNVFGYEIVYRPGTVTGSEGDCGAGPLGAIRNTFLLLGTKVVTGGKKIFLDFPRSLIIEGVGHTLPRDIAIIVIMPDVEAEPEVVLACKALKEAGYILAIDKTSAESGSQLDLLSLAEIIKSPFENNDGTKYPVALTQEHLCLGKTMLAERVETREDYEIACTLGYSLFQGPFFSKPSVIHSREIPGIKLNYLQILQEVNRPELNFSELEKVVKQDTSLCYTILNYVNSAYFRLDEPISSVRHALVLLGEKEVRKWANLILFTFLGFDKPSELIVTSLIRARLCEAIARRVGMLDDASALFLMGMFSVLDVLMGRPMGDILRAIHVSKQVEDALLHRSGVYGDVFETVVNYEMGDWDEFSRYAEKLGIDGMIVPDLYLDAVEWAEGVSDLQEDRRA